MGLPENRKIFESIPTEKRGAAVAFLRLWISDDDKNKIKKAIAQDPAHWFAEYHFFWGMDCRNALRQNGHGETELGVLNLDDVYVELVEKAILG